MKIKMKKIFALVTLVLFVGLVACEKLDENLENPSEVNPSNAQINDLYNNVQLTMASMMNGVWYYPASLVRMTANTSSYQYLNASNPSSFNGIWNTVYQVLWPDIDAVISLAEAQGSDIHIANVKIMKAYSMMVMVDVFGDIPYTESLQGIGIISPSADQGTAIYNAAVDLLNEAITILESETTAPTPTYDNFYNGDKSKWATLAKTLKFRAAVTTRLVNPTESAGVINALVSAGDLIDSSVEDFQFSYGTTRENPNSRHPRYNNSYETTDGDYMSNYYMWLLRAEKEDGSGNPIIDPRIRYYFYRQVEDASALDDSEYSCHFSNTPDQSQKPAWYTAIDSRMPYCVAYEGDGYLGRDHLNSEGIPPDGPLRTIYGLYPFGGLFDENSFDDQQQSGQTGAKGRGIWPIMLASYTDFMRAEAALTIGTTDNARGLLESGVRKSITKVMGFESRDAATFSKQINQRGVLISVKDAFVPDDADVDAYINHVLSLYDAAATDTERLNVVMKEYYIALWGNGIEAYNMYRRTGMPLNMAPALESTPGAFMRSFFLPADHVLRNQNAVQRQITDGVFWDNGSATVY